MLDLFTSVALLIAGHSTVKEELALLLEFFYIYMSSEWAIIFPKQTVLCHLILHTAACWETESSVSVLQRLETAAIIRESNTPPPPSPSPPVLVMNAIKLSAKPVKCFQIIWQTKWTMCPWVSMLMSSQRMIWLSTALPLTWVVVIRLTGKK